MSRVLAYVNDPAQIETIDEVIHDCWFDVDKISFDSNTSILIIRFSREAFATAMIIEKSWLFKKWEVPVKECFLKFCNVESYKINDTERVGTYNLIDMEYDHQPRRIIVNTGVPIAIEIVVRSFEVEVEETDTILGTKVITSLFDVRQL